MEQWLKIEFGLKKDIYDSIYWDSKKKSDLQESFDQVAYEKTGELKVMYKHCYTIFIYLNHYYVGCSLMKAHLKGGVYYIDLIK